MLISDWSSDVCSSDLFRCSHSHSSRLKGALALHMAARRPACTPSQFTPRSAQSSRRETLPLITPMEPVLDRKRVVEGTSVAVRVDLGVLRIITKTTHNFKTTLTH